LCSAVLGIVLFLTANIAVLAIAVLATGALYLSIGLPFRAALSRLKPILLTMLIVALSSLAFNPWQRAPARSADRPRRRAAPEHHAASSWTRSRRATAP
jgi:energy-coupling factor transporter transmembrane protein EcfT